MKCLLVGGSNDGDRINVSDGRNFIYREVKTKPLVIANYGGCVPTKDIQGERYHRGRIRGETEDFHVFVSTEITVDEMLRKLISNYNPLRG